MRAIYEAIEIAKRAAERNPDVVYHIIPKPGVTFRKFITQFEIVPESKLDRLTRSLYNTKDQILKRLSVSSNNSTHRRPE